MSKLKDRDRRLMLLFTSEELEALQRCAIDARRHTRQQAAVYVREALIRDGYLDEDSEPVRENKEERA